MNDIDARGVPVFGGFNGEYRMVHRSRWERVLVNGVAQIYHTEHEAEAAAWRALRAHLCGIIRRDGDIGPIGPKTEREAVFGSAIFTHGRKVAVERKRK